MNGILGDGTIGFSYLITGVHILLYEQKLFKSLKYYYLLFSLRTHPPNIHNLPSYSIRL